ncbi:helix-turn-helix transcriptional regulator [Catenuloplanes japonicus]|uniref:helix-turn-helix transcriptional regulator n=1 Tax=Catenuloplanes japonicus TaxID=33876 RepID=UPI0005243874|nr:WYL domain-containing protein [Catenuloplanes japonicus]
MRASRLVSLLLLLQSHGRLTADRLAAELGVSVRTVYRDVEALSAAGVPVYGEPGHDGGYRLVDGYRTRLTGLTGDEAEALFLTGLPGPAADLGLGAVLAAAELKLRAALPDAARTRADALRQRFHLDPSAWYADGPPPPEHLPAVADAVWERRPLRLRYRRWAAPQTVTRTVRPYGLVLKAGAWYLLADGRHGVRTYRVSQIARVTVLDGTFAVPAEFDLALSWRAYLDAFDVRRHRDHARVLLTPKILDRLADLLEPAVVRAARASAEAASDGRWHVTIPIESHQHARETLLRLGAHAEVLAPATLRAAMAAEATALARRYR